MKPRVLLSALALAGLPLSGWAADCPELLQGQLTKLRSKESIDLCQRYAGKPLVARANLENALGKDYRTAANGYLSISSPRTLSLSLTADF